MKRKFCLILLSMIFTTYRLSIASANESFVCEALPSGISITDATGVRIAINQGKVSKSDVIACYSNLIDPKIEIIIKKDDKKNELKKDKKIRNRIRFGSVDRKIGDINISILPSMKLQINTSTDVVEVDRCRELGHTVINLDVERGICVMPLSIPVALSSIEVRSYASLDEFSYSQGYLTQLQRTEISLQCEGLGGVLAKFIEIDQTVCAKRFDQ